MMRNTLLVLFILVFGGLHAETITIDWKKSNDGIGFTFTNIINLPSYGEMPFFNFSKWQNKKVKDFSYQLQVIETQALSAAELKYFKNCAPNETPIEIKEISSARTKGVASVLFSTIVKNNANQWFKVLKVNIEISNIIFEENVYAKAQAYKTGTSSVLASGRWFKMSVTSSGIYKIDKNFISSLGVDVNSINPKNIRIYGSGGMLPEKVKDQTFFDLPENAIYVAGENDSKFDDGDYVLFYAKGPHDWKYNSGDQNYYHLYNYFSDIACYFITFDNGAGKRIAIQNEAVGSATDITTLFDDFGFYENDAINLNKSGRVWLDKPLNISNTEKNYSFSFPNLDNSTPLKLKIEFCTRSSQSGGNNVYFQENGITFKSFLNQNAVSNGSESNYATLNSTSGITLTPSASTFNIKMKYALPTNESECWLNYIEVVGIRKLIFTNNSMRFRYAASVKNSGITNYKIAGTSNTCIVWDITDPFNVMNQQYNINADTISFKQKADTLKEFLIFNGSSFGTPTYVEQISNQDIHAASPVDYVIVSAPEFLSAAERLANFHHDKHGLSVLVVTPAQVYNEFSSGNKDIGAIRNMMRYFYANASSENELPKYLLLMGDASYDYKNRLNIGGDFVPTFESYEFLSMANSYASDDFYSFLDPNEGSASTNDKADIGIGRIPVTTAEQAEGIVNKIINYSGYGEQVISEYPTATPTLNASYGDWRNKIVFIADDGSDPQSYPDFYMHVSDAESSSNKVKNLDSNLNHVKLYFDAYKKISSAAIGRYPDIEKGIEDVMNRGALIVHYIGHGGEAGWADERVLTISNINNWKNTASLPFFVTATCEFSRFDDPERVSAGELSILNINGGVVGQLTTSRLVYGSSNLDFTDNFYDSLLVNNGYNRPTVGEAIMKAKQATSEGINNNKRKFYLMGDPAMTLAFPTNKIKVNTINQVAVLGGNDTIKALMKVKIDGEIQDINNQFLSNYNGILYATIYDKRQSTKTMNNNNRDSVPYKVQSSIIYKGKAAVINGIFSFEFIVPKDINYTFGNGRISLYAANATSDAAGFFEDFIIGGNSASSISDNVGPEIRLFMNDSNFVFGGLTDENPKIYALIYDESGINTTGNAIGHDLSAMLDNISNNTFILNSNYESDVNSYQRGKVQYQLNDLADGTHTLSMKVWDVNNNSSSANTEFVVAASAQLALSHVLNYPNPFTSSTQFWFEHNYSSGLLDVQIQIMNINGKVVKTINTTIDGTDRSKPVPIPWDGTDDFGDNIGKGVYIYRIKVKTDNDMYAEKIEKLVILK